MRILLLLPLLLACSGETTPVAPPEPAPPVAVAPPAAPAQPAVASYTCPMHPEVRQATAGTCSVCGMNLVAVTEGPLPAHDHRTLHGGQVSMYGDYHVEYLAADGEYRVWVTNATREAITTGLKGAIKDGETTVALTADDTKGLLTGRGEGAGTRPIMVDVTANGQTFSLGFEPVKPAGEAGKPAGEAGKPAGEAEAHGHGHEH